MAQLIFLFTPLYRLNPKMLYQVFVAMWNACASYATMLPLNTISFETDKEEEDFYQYHALLSSPESAAAFAEKLNQQFPG